MKKQKKHIIVKEITMKYTIQEPGIYFKQVVADQEVRYFENGEEVD